MVSISNAVHLPLTSCTSYPSLCIILQVMVPKKYAEFIGNLTFLVNNNFISMSRIDDAVSRILRVKFILGLFEKPLVDLSLADQLGKKVKSVAFFCFLPQQLHPSHCGCQT